MVSKVIVNICIMGEERKEYGGWCKGRFLGSRLEGLPVAPLSYTGDS